MENSPNSIGYLHMILPSKLEVEIGQEDGGLWAKIKNLPGCHTQADNFVELIEMVNDAVFTYFEVPEGMRDKFGFYIPEEVKRRMEEYQMKHDSPAPEEVFEKSFKEIVDSKNSVEFSKAL